MTQQIARDCGAETELRPPSRSRRAQGSDPQPQASDRERAPAEDAATNPLADAALAGSLERLGGIEVRAAVELGTAELLLRDVASLGPGSVLRLDRPVSEPADLTINGRLFARGEVVVVDDHLGLRITELIEASDRGDRY